MDIQNYKKVTRDANDGNIERFFKIFELSLIEIADVPNDIVAFVNVGRYEFNGYTAVKWLKNFKFATNVDHVRAFYSKRFHCNFLINQPYDTSLKDVNNLPKLIASVKDKVGEVIFEPGNDLRSGAYMQMFGPKAVMVSDDFIKACHEYTDNH